MDITALVALLGPALWEVFKTLAEKGADLALDQGLQPLKDQIARGYNERQDAESLRAAIGAALDTLKMSGEWDKYDTLLATLKLTGLDRKTQLALAGAAVEMTRVAPEIISADLLRALDLSDESRALLAGFLFALRQQLKDKDGYRQGIEYANAMDGLGHLRGLTLQMAAVAESLEKFLSLERTLADARRLTDDDARALADYLQEARRRWEGLMLPLLRKKSGDMVTNARLKQVFVPLRLRDVKAEEEARRRMERQRQPERAMRAEDAPRPVEIGDLLNRYPRFILIGSPGCGKTTLLSRVALAFAEGRAAEDLGWQGNPLFPIFFRLRNFGAFLQQNQNQARFPQPCPGSLVAYLESLFRDGERIRLTADFFDRRLGEGNCLILMDGLDEVSDARSEVTAHVVEFVSRYGTGNRFGLASRPRGYESVERQLRPLDLAVAEVHSLERNGIRQLIDNLLRLIERDDALRLADLQDLTREIFASEELTKLAGTPLFCSALVQVYKYHGAKLPNRRVDVLDEVVDLLLGYWHAQQTHLSEAERLAMEDGTGRQYREVKDAVTMKHRRLSHLAEHMQKTLRKAEIPMEAACRVLQTYLQERERVSDEATAETWAENFLINSHERSGLLVESEPGTYAFLHKGFMEYLAASALVNQSKTLVETVLNFAEDEWWEQVILLAGAHPKTPEDLRIEIIAALLQRAAERRPASQSGLRHLILAGELARDMAGHLPGPEHEQVERALYAAAVDPDLPPKSRASAADTLDELGYTPPDLYTFVPVEQNNVSFYIAKYPVTNEQYARFLKRENFENPDLWSNFPTYSAPDENGEIHKIGGRQGWDWLQSELNEKSNLVEDGILYPIYWRDARFGATRRTAPVVGISWWEANAYCKWLMENWETLEEGKQGLPKPKEIRLPTEAEWVLAAGGEWPPSPSRRGAGGEVFAFGMLQNPEKEISRYANTKESGIGRTTPVWMYPQGASPTGVMDMSGNVWEWQANFGDSNRHILALRGGSWSVHLVFARVSDRYFDLPYLRLIDVGFRVVAFPK